MFVNRNMVIPKNLLDEVQPLGDSVILYLDKDGKYLDFGFSPEVKGVGSEEILYDLIYDGEGVRTGFLVDLKNTNKEELYQILNKDNINKVIKKAIDEEYNKIKNKTINISRDNVNWEELNDDKLIEYVQQNISGDYLWNEGIDNYKKYKVINPEKSDSEFVHFIDKNKVEFLDREDLIDDIIEFLNTPETLKESKQLTEDHEIEEYKGYELDFNTDTIDKEGESVEIKIAIRKDGKILNWTKGLRNARKWVDERVAEEERRKKAEQERLKNLNFDIEFDNSSNQYVDFETDSDDYFFG